MTDVSAAQTAVAAPSGERTAARPATSRRLAFRVVALFCGALLLAALFGRIMDFGVRRDEMLFVAPAELLGDWALYTDFFYNHVPYSAWLFRASNLAFGDAGLMFSARLAVFGGWLVLLGATWWGVQRLSGSALLAGFCTVALMTHDTLLGQAGMAASNNLLPLSFGVLALALFLVEIVSPSPRALPLALAGLCVSIAVGMKISGVVLVPPLLIAAILLPRSLTLPERLRRVVLPALVGGVIGALPLFVLLIGSTEVFLAHVTGFHTGPHVAYWEAFAHTEPTLALGARDKVVLAYGAWLSGSALLLAVVAVAAGWMVLSRRTEEFGTLRQLDIGALLTVLGVLACTMVMSFVPTPGFPQYYAAPVVFLPMLAALLVRHLDTGEATRLVPTFAAGLLLMVVLALPRLAPGLMVLRAPAATEVGQFDLGGREIAAALQRIGAPDGRVATLMPVYPLEAGLPVYPELATGQFAYRVTQFLSPELARNYVVAGPEDIQRLFENDPPAAILIGYEPQLEGPFRDYAAANGYVPVAADGLRNRYGNGVLLVPGGEGTR